MNLMKKKFEFASIEEIRLFYQWESSKRKKNNFKKNGGGINGEVLKENERGRKE